MNIHDQALRQRHADWLQTWLGAQPARERWKSAQVTLFVNGALGYQTALNLADLGFQRVRVLPIQASDRAIWQRASGLSSSRPNLAIANNTWNVNEMTLAPSDLLVVAAERPFPELLEAINQASHRSAKPWTQLLAWGNELTLGPTVLPGQSACYACYQTRRYANESRVDVWQARETLFRNDPDAILQGRLQPLTNLAAAYLTSEVARFLGGAPAPIAIGHEVVWDGLYQTYRRSLIVPFEHCPVCRAAQPALFSDSLEQMLDRIQLSQARGAA